MLGIDDFKAKLTGGGARPTLFKVNLNFPALATSGGGLGAAIGGAIAGAAGAAVGGAVGSALGGGNLTEYAAFMVRAASLPASTMGTIEVPFQGRKLKLAGDRTFENWDITVLADTNFKLRNAFEKWSNAMNAHSANTGITNPTSYMSDMWVSQLDRSGAVLKTYIFKGCWPTNVSNIELSHESTDTIETFTVSLAYQYWTSNTTT